MRGGRYDERGRRCHIRAGREVQPGGVVDGGKGCRGKTEKGEEETLGRFG